MVFVAMTLQLSSAAVRAGDDPQPPAATIRTTGTTDSKMAPFDELLTSFVAQHKIPGAAVAVARKGRLVYSRGFGLAEVETDSPVEPTALFRIASISKPVTAIAVLQLVEQGKLGLDERAFDRLQGDERYTPAGSPDPRMATITIRQLLRHTGGWDRDVSFDPMFRPIEISRVLNTEPPAGPAEVIRYMGGMPLDFPPGERYAYSNYGYCVLGRIIERISGIPYDAYVKEHVLKPLGITRMQLGKTLRDGRAEGEVCYYEPGNKRGAAVRGPDLGQEVPLPYGAWNLEAMDAHGGWIASAVDLVRFGSALDDAERSPLLKPASIAEMLARPEGLAGHDAQGKPKPFYYGLGWFVRPHAGGGDNWWHTGSLDGTSTILVRRYDGLTWAVLFNTRNSAPDKAPARLIDPLMHVAAGKIQAWPEGEALAAQR
ncbi:MAG: beta-lactamase family protein [Planctomycetia bacterium]|nr:beta-lactamase family protein [Planctomycetia bacterium]